MEDALPRRMLPSTQRQHILAIFGGRRVLLAEAAACLFSSGNKQKCHAMPCHDGAHTARSLCMPQLSAHGSRLRRQSASRHSRPRCGRPFLEVWAHQVCPFVIIILTLSLLFVPNVASCAQVRMYRKVTLCMAPHKFVSAVCYLS